MTAIKNAFFLLAVALLGACSGGGGSQCQTREACMNDANCKCWCSVQCGYRKKTDNDSPVFIPNDRNGKFCYCKQWDLDYYEDNCINGKKIKQE